jgi:WD40 repeat protein
LSSINNLCIPAEIWHLIFTHLRNEDLSEVLLINTYFYEHVQQSGLLSRPTWQWANYQKILLEHQLTISGEVYKSYPLYQGDMAFALQEDYIRNYNSGYFKRHGWTGRSYPKWKFCQNIIVFCAEADQSIELKGHSGAIEHVIQHTKSLLASLGQDGTIRVWEKLTGSLQQTIRIKQQEKPFYLVSLNHEELACFARNGTAQVWNISTGEWARELLRLDIPEKRIFKCMRHKGFLFIYHNLPQVGDYRHDSLFSVLDLKKEQIIQTLVPENLKATLGNYVQQELIKKPFGWLYNPEPENLLSCPIWIIDCQHHIAVIEQARTNTYYFFDIKNNKPIFGIPDSNLQYKFLSNGTLVILHHTLEGWHVLANYCHETGDFAVKYTFEYSKSEEGKHIYDDFKGCYYEDRAWTILPNGNIVIYYWQREIAHQWSLSRQPRLMP